MPSLDNISWERLERESAVTYPSAAPDLPGEEIVFGDGFPTANGRAGWCRPRRSRLPKCRTTTIR